MGAVAPDLSGLYFVSSVVSSLPVLPSSLSGCPAGCLPWLFELGGFRDTPTLTHCPHIPFGPSRSRASSESELDDEGPCCGDGDPGLFPFPLPRGGAQASSEESEEEGTSEDLHLPADCHYATRPPRPQAVRTWGGDLGCWVAQRSCPTVWGGSQCPPCISGPANRVPSLCLQFCTFGSRLVSPGCYVFSRRLDRFCSALSSMLERHLSSHMWK